MHAKSITWETVLRRLIYPAVISLKATSNHRFPLSQTLYMNFFEEKKRRQNSVNFFPCRLASSWAELIN